MNIFHKTKKLLKTLTSFVKILYKANITATSKLIKPE